MSENLKLRLKRCPFCGSDNVSIRRDGYDDHTIYIACGNCKAWTDYYRTTKEAVRAWNMRRQ